MPEKPNENGNAPEPTAESTSSGPASSDPEFRYGPDAGILAGLTPREAIDRVNRLGTEVRQYVGSLENQVRQMSQPQPEQPDPVDLDLELLESNPEQFKQQLSAQVQNQIHQLGRQALNPVYEQFAAVSRSTARSSSTRPDVWKRYGAEIEAEVNQLPVHMRTPKAYERAEEMVAGRHIDDLVNERASEIAASAPGVVRGSETASGPDSSDPNAELWARLEENPTGRQMLELENGRSKIREVARKRGISLEEFVNQVTRGTGSRLEDSSSKVQWHSTPALM